MKTTMSKFYSEREQFFEDLREAFALDSRWKDEIRKRFINAMDEHGVFAMDVRKSNLKEYKRIIKEYGFVIQGEVSYLSESVMFDEKWVVIAPQKGFVCENTAAGSAEN